MKQGQINRSTLAVIIASLASPLGGQAKEVIAPRIMSYVKTVTYDHFASNLNTVQVNSLLGGYGTATNITLDIAGKTYVLRVISTLESPLKRNAELYAMKAAAAIGVAPAIRWISPDENAILMDYIAGGILTLEKGKNPKLIFKITDLMRKVHALQKNTFYAPSFEAAMNAFYRKYAPEDSNQTIWEEAMSIIKEGESQLQSLNAPMVNTHGDLNPRNILISEQTVYFIDWSDVTYTDPFQDLARFSIVMDYNSQEEAYLMQCYLGRGPTMNEKKRFRIAKKMNFARLALNGQCLGNEIGSKQKNKKDAAEPLRVQTWSYCAQMFATNNVSLSAQFFWEQAQVALASAKDLNINDID